MSRRSLLKRREKKTLRERERKREKEKERKRERASSKVSISLHFIAKKPQTPHETRDFFFWLLEEKKGERSTPQNTKRIITLVF